MCAELVTVRIQDGAGSREIVANLEDISTSGACLLLEATTEAGADVEMMCAKCRLRGKVRYCSLSDTGYDVGVAFDEKGSWDRKRFAPKHLLAVAITGRVALSRPVPNERFVK
jgi:hypothetical protein